MNNYHYLLKFIIIGDTCVGKSCLLLQFTDSRFRNEHDATIGVEFGSRISKINDKSIKLQVWDTAGSEAFKSITRSYYRGSIGGILVFDVTKRSSFEGVIKWYQEIQGYACDKIEIALVANKIDIDGKREITTDEAQAFAKEYGFAYFETSAKTGQNVDTLFETMAQTILKRIDSGEIDPSQEIYGIKVGQGIANVQNKQTPQQDSHNPKPLTGNQTSLENKKVVKKQKGCC